MYNDDLKNRFFAENNISSVIKNDYMRLFQKSYDMESRLGLDLCQIKDKDELNNYLALICGVKKSTNKAILGKIKRYIRWCVENNIDNSTDAILNMEFTQEERFSRDLVGSADDLNRYLNTIFDKEIKKTYDNVYRCYFWMAFIGVDIKYVYDIKNEEVNIEKRQITHEGKTYEICHEAIPSIKNCATLDGFMYSHPNYTNDIYRARIQSNQLMRGIKSETKRSTFLSGLTKRLNTNSERRLSYERVLLSGIFCRLYQTELDGFPINFDAAATYFLTSSQNKIVIRRNITELEQQYNVWKKVFRNDK